MNKANYSSVKKPLSLLAPAKINLHLEVLGLRKDGFHELSMVMQSIDLVDQIEISKTNDERITLVSSDPSLSTGKDNLIIKAAELIRSRSGLHSLGAYIELTKNIPIGAGLAGGSSDCAATLVGLNAMWELNFNQDQLKKMASELGSDTPFCISGGTQFCFGRGERLEPIQLLNSKMAVVLVKDPNASVSTPWAYTTFKEIHSDNYLSREVDFEKKRNELRNGFWLKNFKDENPRPLVNDLQEIVASRTPAVKTSLDFLVSLTGAVSVAMSGSGASCFALYPDFHRAKSAFESKRVELERLGLEGWCCSFSSTGVRFAK